MSSENESIPQVKLNPFSRYRAMRETDPVFYNEKIPWWEVYRYDDVLRIINDPASFSSEHVPAQVKMSSILRADPPQHRQLRSLVSQAFTPRTTEQLIPRITTIVNDLLDSVEDAGQMDVVKDFAGQLPVIVIAEILGVPTNDRVQFKRWSDAFVNFFREESRQAVKDIKAYFKEFIAQQRDQSDKPESLINGLLAAQVNGKHLTEAEILDFCVLLLTGGNETTANLISSAFLCFDEYPEVMEQIRHDPSLLPGTIEEVLRYRSPFQICMRAAMVDVEIGGKKIHAGELVVPMLGSANRDETQFPHPEVFDIRRSPNRHVAFGHGIHFCLGAPLSRLEARIALQIALERFNNIKRVREIPLEPLESPTAYGVKHLPVTFEKRGTCPHHSQQLSALSSEIPAHCTVSIANGD